MLAQREAYRKFGPAKLTLVDIGAVSIFCIDTDAGIYSNRVALIIDAGLTK